MEQTLVYILISVILISIISLVGIVFLAFKQKSNSRIMKVLVAFAAGSLFATAFFDLIPESFAELGSMWFVLIGIILFFILESLIHWHHSHDEVCKDCESVHPVAYLNLLSDGMHNLLDGIIIAAGFLSGVSSGIAVSIAITLHEIPQELGDFAVLVSSGLTRARALFYNFISALTAVIGGLVGYYLFNEISFAIPYIIAIAAGGFIYIAGSDLFPELHKESKPSNRLIQIISLLAGILVIWFALSIFPE